MVYLSKL